MAQEVMYRVTSQATGPKASTVAILLGTYAEQGENHGRPTYQKTEPIPGHPDLKVFIYFWDTRDGLENSGWWFGDSVGGTLVWARAPLLAQMVPPVGWKVPWDAPAPEPGVLSVQRDLAVVRGAAAFAPKARPLTAAAHGLAPPNVVGSLLAAAMQQAPQQEGQKAGTVYVAGLPSDATEEELAALFSNVGAVEAVQIYRDESSGLPLGHGFCDFYDASHALLAVQQLQGSEYRGSRLSLDRQDPRAEAEEPSGTGIRAEAPRMMGPAAFMRPPAAPVLRPPGAAAAVPHGVRPRLQPPSPAPVLQPPPGLQLQPPPLAGARPAAARTGSVVIPLSVPQEFLDQLVDSMKQTSGSNPDVACKFDRACKSVNCTETHANGREIEEMPMTIICRFQRSCKRQGCFYVHPNGREMDESPELGVCNKGRDCNVPDCIFSHPAMRVPVLMKCEKCHQLGHTKFTCPTDLDGGTLVETAKIKLSGFPPEWSADGGEALVSRIFEELVPFGTLVAPPELSPDGLSAVAEFDKPASSLKAVHVLNNRTSLTVEKIYEKKEDPKKCSVFIANIVYEATEEELRERLENVGLVKSMRLVRDKDTGAHKGYAFCDFHDSFTADAAIQVLNGAEFHGRPLRVNIAGEGPHQKAVPTPGRASAAPAPTTCQAVISHLSEGLLAMSPEELCIQLKQDLEIFGKMTRDPTVEHYGTKWQQVVVEYETQEVGELTAQAMSSEGLFQMKLRPVPSTAGRKPQFNPEERTKATLFVGNLSFETSEDSLREALEQRAGELQNLESVSVARHKDTNVGRGFGFLVFSDEASALAALERLRGAEVDGRKVRIDQKGKKAEQPPRERSRSRDRGRGGGEGAVTVTIFVDELSMPSRPHLEPFAEDREVWVDPLLDESGGHEWLQEFGALEGVFRVPDVGTGEETERGYARFTTHEAAERCVRSGCATWSESERILSSQSKIAKADSGGGARGRRERRSAYPESIMAEIIGPKGENISNIQKAIGARMLAVRGEGLDNNQTGYDRLHFVCKGDADCASKLQPALERAVAEIHARVTERLESGYYERERGKNGKEDGAAAAEPDAKPMVLSIAFTLLGKVIGRGGETIKQLQKDSGARINVSKKSDAPGGNRDVTICGPQSCVDKAKQLIDDILRKAQAPAHEALPEPPPGAWGPYPPPPPGAWGMPPPHDAWGGAWGPPPPADAWGALPPPGALPPGAPPPGPPPGWAPPPGWEPRPMRDYAPEAVAMLRHHGVLDRSFDEDMIADLLDEHFGWQSMVDPVQVRPYMDGFLRACSELKVAVCGGRAAPTRAASRPAPPAPSNAQRPGPAPSSSRPSRAQRLESEAPAEAAGAAAPRRPPPPPPPPGSDAESRWGGTAAMPLSSKASGAPPAPTAARSPHGRRRRHSSRSPRGAEGSPGPARRRRRGSASRERPPLPPEPPPGGRPRVFVPSRAGPGDELEAERGVSVFVPSNIRGEDDFPQDGGGGDVPTYLRDGGDL